MSNLEHDPRMRNGWAEYQRLVLAELERLNKSVGSLNDRLNDMQVQIALLKEENGRIKQLQAELRETRLEISSVKQGDAIDDAIKKYRNWIIGLIFAVIVSTVIPIANILIG